ncbi:MAG: sialate O-acetylesterase [Verrucomicrobia bacterium]|nr:sialate O-acetylesterase [Verrucomicrobiota bacterium]
MKTQHGLMPGQVLQRGKKGRGCAHLTGTCRVSGNVELRVLRNDKELRSHGWKPAGTAAGRRFEAQLENLPTGGPYRVELRIRSGRKIADTTSIDAVFVGDVWILAGQSNMQGIGNLVHAPHPHAKVRAFYMRDEWGVAEESLHFLEEAVDVFHNGYGDGPDRPSRSQLAKLRRGMIKGVSPGLAFGLEMRRRTRVPQGLIACAHGGTSMEQWSPDLRNKGGASLYGAMIRRYQKLGQPVAGILWYQGESDAHPDAVDLYTQRMIDLIAATRRDMDLPQLPWAIVQLGCHACAEDHAEWNSIQEQQRQLPCLIPRLDVVPAIDLELDDGIHIGGKGQQQLGCRLARAANRLVHRAAGVKPGIALKTIELAPTPFIPGAYSVLLRYRNVAGKLCSPGRPAGFSLVNKQGEDVHAIYKTTVQGSTVLLHTGMPRDQFTDLSISYGHGRYPICTISDSEGMSLPGMKVTLKETATPLNGD